jgi:aryl-alcohol dehydrogenase-like predicted oxidoreductase
MNAGDRIPLGKTGLQVPPMGTGVWAWGDRTYWGYGRSYQEADVRQAFDCLIKAGLNFFDTAELYGNGLSERILGRFVQETGAQVITATKFMPYPWRIRQNSLLTALQNSLKRLQMEQVDLYQIHQPLPPRRVEVWAQALAEAVKAGLTRAVGVSNYNEEQMRRAADVLGRYGIPLASNQVEYSLLMRKVEKNGLLRLCQDMGITLIAYSPLGMGLLTGKYTAQNPPPGIRGKRYSRQGLEKLQELTGLLREIGQGHGGKTPPQVALNWTICKGTFPIPGAKNARQAEENAGALGWSLTPDEIQALEQAADRFQAHVRPRF